MPFFIKLEMCTETDDRVMPARSASSCWDIIGFSSIQESSSRSLSVTICPTSDLSICVFT